MKTHTKTIKSFSRPAAILTLVLTIPAVLAGCKASSEVRPAETSLTRHDRRLDPSTWSQRDRGRYIGPVAMPTAPTAPVAPATFDATGGAR